MMDEIIKRYERALKLYTETWERRVRAYNDHVAVALIESWKDVETLISKVRDKE